MVHIFILDTNWYDVTSTPTLIPHMYATVWYPKYITGDHINIIRVIGMSGPRNTAFYE